MSYDVKGLSNNKFFHCLVGVIHLNDCSLRPNIPVYLILFGTAILVALILTILMLLALSLSAYNVAWLRLPILCLSGSSCVVYMYSLCCLITGERDL